MAQIYFWTLKTILINIGKLFHNGELDYAFLTKNQRSNSSIENYNKIKMLGQLTI